MRDSPDVTLFIPLKRQYTAYLGKPVNNNAYPQTVVEIAITIDFS